MGFFKEDLKHIKAFVFDVDGVFSKSSLLLETDGELLRTMNIKDGFIVRYAASIGFPIGIISGGDSESVRIRFNNLGVEDVYLKSRNKLKDFNHFIIKNNLKPSEVLFMGDDLPDYDILTRVGLPTCPMDAAEEIRAVSKYISDKNGGDGCVRDVMEQVLRSQGKWDLDNMINL
jgi:3-deoxy-D-manno-octulosonate 8-phosphate phosphatase (KDO 8-P phosphatase)